MSRIGKTHKVGYWVTPLRNPMYGLYKEVRTGSFRVRPCREYTLEVARWKFGSYLKKPEYTLRLVETTKTRTKPEPWEDTRLA